MNYVMKSLFKGTRGVDGENVDFEYVHFKT